MVVYRTAPREWAYMHIDVPSAQFLASNALGPLARFSNAGISVVRRTSPRSRSASSSSFKRKRFLQNTLSVTDTLRFSRHRTPQEKIASFAVDSDKHFCIVGNLASSTLFSSQTTPSNPHLRSYGLLDLFRMLRQRQQQQSSTNASDRQKTRVYVRDDSDVWMLRTVLFTVAAKNNERAFYKHLESFVDVVVLVPDRDHGHRLGRDGDQEYYKRMSAAVKSHGGKGGNTPTLFASMFSVHHDIWNELHDTECVWYGYENMDAHRLKLAAPFAIINNVDVPSKLLPHVIGDRKEYAVVSVHTVFFGHTAAERNPMMHTCCVALVRGHLDRIIDVTATNNFLTMYFPFYGAALRAMSTVNEELYRKRYANPDTSDLSVGIPKFSVLEQFAQESGDADASQKQQVSPLSIPMHQNVSGFMYDTHRGNLRRFEVKAFSKSDKTSSHLLVATRVPPQRDLTFLLRGIPLRLWDRVHLNGQDRPSENGLYYVVGFRRQGRLRILVLQDKLSVRLDAAHDTTNASKTYGQLGGNTTVVVTLSLASHPKLRTLSFGDKVFFPRMLTSFGVTGTVTNVSKLDVTVVIDQNVSPLADGKTDPMYYCTKDPQIKVKEQCEEENKLWDRPCVDDLECPYYQANKNYPNYRGGCTNGYCEMPLGVKLAAFRRVDAAQNEPVCHGCQATFQTNREGGQTCCESQGDRPDYAFPLDEFERRAHFQRKKREQK